ncbi:hypothetical protein [Actinosynnema pretiosum]|uniref:SD-repeat containing protein B domain-containing protein n=1 Tax=Actinosynnema pretiosum TaxID=42197 RepID=A0A290ZFL9_9PSEU|nr:hypothetical protein [Actinosynnema pretiosum]ATE57769.1 hypothetical protein CNX65_34370 [Actinosynnema pretiosum]
MKKLVAVTAVLMLLGGGTALAQDGEVLDGLIWFDRNGNGVVDAGEPALASGKGVRVFNAATKEHIGDYGTDANGRYRATGLPAGVPLAIYNANTDRYATTTPSSVFRTGGATLDFGIRGGVVTGSAFVDADRDGVRDAGERELQPAHRLGGLTATGSYRVEDVPEGDHELVLADLRAQGLLPSAVTAELFVGKGEQVRLDTPYFAPRADLVLGALKLGPDKPGARATGDEVELSFAITNSGEAADGVRFTVDRPKAKLLSTGEGVVAEGDGFALTAPLEPGATATARLRYALTDPTITGFRVVLAPGTSFGDGDPSDNTAEVALSVTAPPSSTPPSTTSTAPGSSTAPTTTAPPVGGAPKQLARTGAAPFWPLVTGLALLVAGLALHHAARTRRRRA